jgi:hypothetical protein
MHINKHINKHVNSPCNNNSGGSQLKLFHINKNKKASFYKTA